jgi:hypothetical protein
MYDHVLWIDEKKKSDKEANRERERIDKHAEKKSNIIIIIVLVSARINNRLAADATSARFPSGEKHSCCLSFFMTSALITYV